MVLDLKVEVGGLKLSNPLILASGPLGYSIRSLKRFADEGFGAVTSKTLTPLPWEGNPPPRVVNVKPYYLLNSDGLRNPGFESFFDQMSEWKVEHIPLIVSITAGTIEEWVEGAKLMEEGGADVVQLNTGCQHVPAETHWGAYWSQDPDRFMTLVQALKEEVKIPIWTKTIHTTLAEKAGADANVVGGFYPGLLIDTTTGKPKIGNLDILPTVTGPPAKPSGLKNLVLNAKKVDIPLIGSGGVMTGLDVVEYFMVGASAVELYTSAYWEGPGIARKIMGQISEYLEEHDSRSLNEIRGITLKYI